MKNGELFLGHVVGQFPGLTLDVDEKGNVAFILERRFLWPINSFVGLAKDVEVAFSALWIMEGFSDGQGSTKDLRPDRECGWEAKIGLEARA